MDGLLSCPFCGEEPEFPSVEETYGTHYEGGCDNCGIAKISLSIIDCFDHPREKIHESWDKDKCQYATEYIEVVRQIAIDLWNKRY